MQGEGYIFMEIFLRLISVVSRLTLYFWILLGLCYKSHVLWIILSIFWGSGVTRALCGLGGASLKHAPAVQHTAHEQFWA